MPVAKLLLSMLIVAVVASAFTVGPAFANQGNGNGNGHGRGQDEDSRGRDQGEDELEEDEDGDADKVLVCHNVGTDEQTELRVPAHSAVATKHVEEGRSILGPCPLPYL
jgi:hypothetical protein